MTATAANCPIRQRRQRRRRRPSHHGPLPLSSSRCRQAGRGAGQGSRRRLKELSIERLLGYAWLGPAPSTLYGLPDCLAAWCICFHYELSSRHNQLLASFMPQWLEREREGDERERGAEWEQNWPAVAASSATSLQLIAHTHTHSHAICMWIYGFRGAVTHLPHAPRLLPAPPLLFLLPAPAPCSYCSSCLSCLLPAPLQLQPVPCM